MGNHLLAAFTAKSLREAIPHFEGLKQLLPNFNNTHIEIIFGRPFIEFRRDKSIYTTDPDFTRRLEFNDKRKVFVHNSLMMGVHDTRTTYGGQGVPPHLLAFDMKTEKMIWGIPLTPLPEKDLSLDTSAAGGMTFGLPRMGRPNYHLNQVGNLISLQFFGENKVHFFHPETGELNFILKLPKVAKD